jgi:hypothetical protein
VVEEVLAGTVVAIRAAMQMLLRSGLAAVR